MNIAHLLRAAARSFPDRPAVSVGARTVLTYRELGSRTARLAGALAQTAPPGSCIAIALPNCVEYLEILFAIWHAGMTAVPLNHRLHANEMRHIAEDCGAPVIFATDELATALVPATAPVRILVPDRSEYRALLQNDCIEPVPRGPNESAWIFYTSGTTGKPKGAILTHANLHAMLNAYFADIDFLDSRDALVHFAATSHASGLLSLSHIAKASNNVFPESGGFDAHECAQLVNAYESLSFFLPPTVLRRLCRDPKFLDAQVGRIKCVLLGAAPISPSDLKEGCRLFGPRLWNGYGQGESPCTITAMSKSMIADAIAAGDEHRLASVGIARTGTTVDVVDAEGRSVPLGETGEVVVRGQTVMQGYLHNPTATAETLRNGWLRTGDLGRLDDHGYLTLLDRAKDLIISGGMNIYAREVEDVLLMNRQILEVAVVGVPDPQWGESVVAVIIPAPGATVDAADLDRLCLQHIARFKRPKRYVCVASLPKNPAGKVLKRELREQYAARMP